MVRFYGKWELLNRGEKNSGTLNWKIEHRHRYGAVAPSGYSLNAGNVGIMGAPFSNQGPRMTNFYWRQGLGENWVSYVGFLDATDVVDVWALASPWTGFTNLAYSTGSASMALPNDATLGAMLGGFLTDSIYVMGSLTDLNSDPTSPFGGFETFFDKNEYFKSVELGWTQSKDRFFFDNVHLTFWHVDEIAASQTPDGWGLNFSASTWIDDTWMPFLRAGFAEDGGSLLERSVSTGAAVSLFDQRDLLGLAANWGRPNPDTFAPGLDDQFGIEAFYRLQLTQSLRVTPSVQLLFDPALNPDEDFLAVFGLRGVATF
jgi:porin